MLAEKQLSGKWLANEIGCTENTVSQWCTNKAQPSLENLFEIAEALKVDIKDLLRSSQNNTESSPCISFFLKNKTSHNKRLCEDEAIKNNE